MQELDVSASGQSSGSNVCVRSAVALISCPIRRRRIADAFTRIRGATWGLRFCERFRDGFDFLPGAQIVILEPIDRQGSSTVPLVREARRRQPRIVIVAYCSAELGAPAQILEMARAGVDRLILAGVDDTSQTLAAIAADSEREAHVHAICAELGARLPEAPLELMRQFLSAAMEPHSVAAVAANIGVH